MKLSPRNTSLGPQGRTDIPMQVTEVKFGGSFTCLLINDFMISVLRADKRF